MLPIFHNSTIFTKWPTNRTIKNIWNACWMMIAFCQWNETLTKLIASDWIGLYKRHIIRFGTNVILMKSIVWCRKYSPITNVKMETMMCPEVENMWNFSEKPQITYKSTHQYFWTTMNSHFSGFQIVYTAPIEHYRSKSQFVIHLLKENRRQKRQQQHTQKKKKKKKI